MNAKPAAAPALGPSEAASRATEMLDLMMRLADLLQHETERLRSGHVQDVAPLQKEKLRLSLLYQRAMKELEAGGVKITALPAPLRAQIVAASARLADAVGENERALRVGRAAARRLLDMVVESVKERLKPVSRYNARRTTAGGAPILAVAVDRRL